MGSWKLEVFRMGLYMSFPVFMFNFFNHPQWYEESVMAILQKSGLARNLESKKGIENLKVASRKAYNDRIEKEYSQFQVLG